MGIYLPKTADTRPFGLDVSKYQGYIDWNKASYYQNPRVQYCGIRSGISWGYTDKWFARNWSEADRVGFDRLAYHVLYPLESPVEQVKHFKDIVGAKLTDADKLVIDVELVHNASPRQLSNATWAFIQESAMQMGKMPIVYTRPQFVKAYMERQSWFADVYWWMATYTYLGSEHPGPLGVVDGIPADRYLIHQTSSKGQGKTFGMESHDLDYNRFLGTQAEYDTWMGDAVPVPDPTTPAKVEIQYNPNEVNLVLKEVS